MSTEKESNEVVGDEAEKTLENRLKQGIDLLKKQDWDNGRMVFNDIVNSSRSDPGPDTQNVICTALVGYLLCLLTSNNKVSETVKISRKLLGLKVTEASHTRLIARYFLVRGLIEQLSFKDAGIELTNWLKADDTLQPVELLKEIHTNVTDEVANVDEQLKTLQAWIDEQPFDGYTKGLPRLAATQEKISRKSSDSDEVGKKKENSTSKVINSSAAKETNDDSVSCSYCSLRFKDRSELRAHCQSDEHQKILMSDEG